MIKEKTDMKMKFQDIKVGKIVGIHGQPPSRNRAMILKIYDNKLFNSVKCVRVMVIGDTNYTHQLSDRLYEI